jgi:uncharacterized protein
MTSSVRPLANAAYGPSTSHAPAHLQPVSPDERIHGLDLLRGWAMFGVLWSNLNDWYGTEDPATRLDRGLAWAQGTLIESRFYSLLCVLFGVGFGIQLVRAADRGLDIRTTYLRRSAALLAIGLVHGLLIWQGDILTMYALVSFAMLMFRDASPRRLLVAAALSWLIAPEIVLATRYMAGLHYMVPRTDPTTAYWVLGHGTWTQIQAIRAGNYLDWFQRWGLMLYWSILAMFLLGLWSVKSGFLRRAIEQPATTRRLLGWSIVAAGLGLGLARVVSVLLHPLYGDPGWWTEPRFWYRRRLAAAGFDLSAAGTALVYASLLLLLWQTRRGGRVLRPLAATGRMALTTYLTQSVVCTFLFYSYGFRLVGRVGYSGMFGITLALFGVQMAVSMWWLRRYRFGPVEWLWRTLTYGAAPAMRIATSDGAT